MPRAAAVMTCTQTYPWWSTTLQIALAVLAGVFLLLLIAILADILAGLRRAGKGPGTD